MSSFIKEMINNKLKHLSIDELLHYGDRYGFSINKSEAIEIATYLKNNDIDPFDHHHRLKMFHELANITDLDTANKARNLFTDLIRDHGLDHLFK